MNSFISQGKGLLASRRDALQSKPKDKSSNHVDGLTNNEPFGALPSFEPEDMLPPDHVETFDDSEDIQSREQPNANNGFQVITGNIGPQFAGKFGHTRDTFRRGYDNRDKLGNDNMLEDRTSLASPIVANGQQIPISGRSFIVANDYNETHFTDELLTVGGQMHSSVRRTDPTNGLVRQYSAGDNHSMRTGQYSFRGTERVNTPIVRVYSIAGTRPSVNNVSKYTIHPGAISHHDKRGTKSKTSQADSVEAKNGANVKTSQADSVEAKNGANVKTSQADSVEAKNGANKRCAIRDTTHETLNERRNHARAYYIGLNMDEARELSIDNIANVRQTPIKLQQQSDSTQVKQVNNSGTNLKGKVDKNHLIQNGSSMKASHIDPVGKQAQGVSGGFHSNSSHISTPVPSNSTTSNGPPNQPAREEAKSTAFDNFGAEFSMDNIKQNGHGFLSANTGIDTSQIQDFGITGEDPSDRYGEDGEAESETDITKPDPENVLGMFAALSKKVDNKANTTKGSSCSTDDSGGEKYFVARFEDTRGPSCSYTKGVIVRLLLIALNTFTTVLAVNTSGNHFLWGCPPFCGIFLSLEYAAVVFKRLGREWTCNLFVLLSFHVPSIEEGKHSMATKDQSNARLPWLPCLIVYLVTSLPLVWELQLQNSGFDEDGEAIETDIWTIVVCDATVYVTIFARWMLQGGVVSILTLATVLLDFLANASDIMDLLSLTDETEVRTNSTLLYWVLIAWSLSFVKFIPLIEQMAGEKPKTMPGCIQRNFGPKFTDILQTLFTLLLLDGSFLMVRLYLLIAESVVTFSLIFFVVKNVLGFVMQFHRLVVLCRAMPCVQRLRNQEPEV